ncbi:MAG: TMEM175 family protein [Pedobacter sp.]|nr:TMEM175 family protein [Pedobacter sp.]MDQ8054396.1 TMEM175 family protein [Pedobacter sp.]
MKKGRIEAFSDGVIAIIITIMVLELKVPHNHDFAALFQLWPVFLSYVLSFIYVGIYWNNHHHMFAVVNKVNGAVLWANLHLLFWLSMIPFATAWMGENHFAALPIALYGFVLLMNGVAYSILTTLLIRHHGHESVLYKAVGSDFKGKLSVACYLIAIPCAFWQVWLSAAIYTLVALIWLVPDKRIERVATDSL